MAPSSFDRTADLLARAAAGDGAAFDRVFARALPRLVWFVELRLGPDLRRQVEPLDVVQDTYAQALAQLPRFEHRGEGSFVRWLLALAGNRIRSVAAHHGAHHRRAVRSVGPADAAIALAEDPLSGPCTRAARLELRERLASSLARLARDEREALVARVLEGRPIAEVAASLGRSESAVRRLVAAALARVGRELGEEERYG